MSTAIKLLNGLQDNDDKQKVRDIITKTAIDFAKTNRVQLNLLTLPSTKWGFEKGLIKATKASKVKIKTIRGIENGHDDDGKPIYPVMAKGKPRNRNVKIETNKMDFDKAALTFDANFIWADYCGNPAEFKTMCKTNGKHMYSYPHLETFAEIVARAEGPMVYSMTFCCNGRIIGGKDAMRKALGHNAKTMPSAIRSKIGSLLSAYGLTDKVTEICRIFYKGGKQSYMTTFVFAINFEPKTKKVKHIWTKGTGQEKEAFTPNSELEMKTMRRKAIHALSDKGWDSETIAQVLSISKRNVGSVLAWHLNPDSFRK